jgi:type I restriction enzyme S subunit
MNFINNDSAVPGLNRNQAYSNQFLLPPESLVQKFASVVDPHYEAKRMVLLQNERLKTTRDALLARLITGSLPVDTFDISLASEMTSELRGKPQIMTAHA